MDVLLECVVTCTSSLRITLELHSQILMMHLIFLNFASWTCLQVSLIQPINLKSFVYLSNLRIVVATMAFGMGVDCPNIRQIIHVGLLDDISSYVQETGRAG